MLQKPLDREFLVRIVNPSGVFDKGNKRHSLCMLYHSIEHIEKMTHILASNKSDVYVYIIAMQYEIYNVNVGNSKHIIPLITTFYATFYLPVPSVPLSCFPRIGSV